MDTTEDEHVIGLRVLNGHQFYDDGNPTYPHRDFFKSIGLSWNARQKHWFRLCDEETVNELVEQIDEYLGSEEIAPTSMDYTLHHGYREVYVSDMPWGFWWATECK